MALPKLTDDQYAGIENHLQGMVATLLKSNPLRDRIKLGCSIGNMRVFMTISLGILGDEGKRQTLRCMELVKTAKDRRLHSWHFDYPGLEIGHIDEEYIRPGMPIIRVDCISEMWTFVRSHPCQCGGVWDIGTVAKLDKVSGDEWGHYDRFELQCLVCDVEVLVGFRVDTLSEKYLAELKRFGAKV